MPNLWGGCRPVSPVPWWVRKADSICIQNISSGREEKGLAIVKKFHDYLLFGWKFQIRTNYKPLQHLFDEHHPQASARIQWWALTLSAYNYAISYKPGNEHANADSLSRLPLGGPLKDPPQPAELVFLMDTLQASPVTPQNILTVDKQRSILS